jgi:hypothetical protein
LPEERLDVRVTVTLVALEPALTELVPSLGLETLQAHTRTVYVPLPLGIVTLAVPLPFVVAENW